MFLRFLLLFILLFPSVYLAPINYNDWTTYVETECYFSKQFNEVVGEKAIERFRLKSQCAAPYYSLRKIFETPQNLLEFASGAKFKPANDLHGAENVVDLLLSRVGIFNFDWSDDRNGNELLDKSICKPHYDELFRAWKNRDHVPQTKGKNKCTFPQDNHHVQARNYLSKQETQRYFQRNEPEKRFFQTGAGVCTVHHQLFIEPTTLDSQLTSTQIPTTMEVNQDECNQSSDEDTQLSDDEDEFVPIGNDLDINGKTELRAYISHLFGLNFAKHSFSTVPLSDLAKSTQQKKLSSSSKILDSVTKILNPHSASKLKENFCRGSTPETNAFVNELMEKIVDAYNNADSFTEKTYILSHAVFLPYIELSKYLTTSYYQYQQAKKIVLKPAIKLEKHYSRFNDYDLKQFIDFITSDLVLVGLPWGSKSVTLTNGKKIDIPRTVRLQQNAEIIRMYKATKSGKESTLSTSTMFRILKSCTAIRSKAMTCVDMFDAQNTESFLTLQKILDSWYERQLIDEQTSKRLKYDLQQSKQYLKTDYKIQLALHSPVTAHCITRALNDAKNARFSNECPEPTHNFPCKQCDLLDETLSTIKSIVEEKLTESEEGSSFDLELNLLNIEESEQNIFEFRRHVVRTVYSEMERKRILDELDENTALITLDWSQKMLPTKYREKQEDYFSKRGMSWHISHVMSKIGTVFVSHTFIHVLPNSKQDSKAVVSIVNDVLGRLENLRIHKVILRSDNAGCYRSQETIANLREIANFHNIAISKWTFSEVQAGKSSCDRKAAQAKRVVRAYIDRQNNVETELQLYQALTSDGVLYNDGALSHTTIIYAKIGSSTKSKQKTVISSIRLYSEFNYNNDHLMIRKFPRFGTGLKVEYKNLPSVEISFLEVVVYKPLNFESKNYQTEVNKIHNEADGDFWSINKPRTTRSKNDALFKCEEENCIDEFESIEELQNHLEVGEHTYESGEKLNIVDSAMLQYCKNIDGNIHCTGNQQVNPSSSSDTQIIETSLGIESELMKEIQTSTSIDSFPVGWAHRQYKSRTTFNRDVKTLITQYFEEGRKDKTKKVSPVEARHRLLKMVRDGTASFSLKDVPQALQIKSLFQVMTSNSKKVEESDEPKEKKQRVEIEEEEKKKEEEEEEEEVECQLNEEPDEINQDLPIIDQCGGEKLLQRQRDQEINEIRKAAFDEAQNIDNENDN